MLHKENQNIKCTDFVAAIDDSKSIFKFVKMLLIDGVTLSLSDVYEIANHGCCVALDRQNRQTLSAHSFIMFLLPLGVTATSTDVCHIW